MASRLEIPSPNPPLAALLPLELVHSDLHGPLPPTANGYKYWISFTDDASRFRRCWLLHKKSEAFDAFKQYKAWAEKQTGKLSSRSGMTRVGSICLTSGSDFMLEHGIERQHTVRATPQQNGVAERTNRILDEGVASLLSDSHFPARFWGEALSCFPAHSQSSPPPLLYPGRRLLKPSMVGNPLSPISASLAAGLMPMCRRTSVLPFSPSPGSAYSLDIPLDYKGWKCWDPVTGDVFISRDVRFVETEMPGAELGLSGPRYEPLRVQPGSVGEPAGNVPAPSCVLAFCAIC